MNFYATISFVGVYLKGNFCCEVLPVPLKLVSYYAANFNSDMPTVKSANPNALVFAFKNWPLPRTNWVNSIVLS